LQHVKKARYISLAGSLVVGGKETYVMDGPADQEWYMAMHAMCNLHHRLHANGLDTHGVPTRQLGGLMGALQQGFVHLDLNKVAGHSADKHVSRKREFKVTHL
jgi:hypothetical protein